VYLNTFFFQPAPTIQPTLTLSSPLDLQVCTPDGTVMDIVNAVPYIRKFKRHPVTGAPLELKDLTRLHFHKNTDGEYVCPALGKVFNAHTHIVAIGSSGHVYCWEAVEELCLKTKNMRDLVTDEGFTKRDLIHIQVRVPVCALCLGSVSGQCN
jgi:peptidyl-prolyl cis-trans isomerase-like 2